MRDYNEIENVQGSLQSNILERTGLLKEGGGAINTIQKIVLPKQVKNAIICRVLAY